MHTVRLLEISMKMLATAFCVLVGGILSSSAAEAPSTTPEQPEFKIEIRATGKKGPGFAVTNLTAKTVTACVFELSYSSQGTRRSKIVWDALVQGDPPIEPGRTILRPLILIVGSSVPNKAEVIAGVWADGESFGQPVWANNIFKNRALRASEYEDAAAILQQGLDQNWTPNQYQQAFSNKPDSGPVYTVRTALTATQQTAQTPQAFTHTMQFLLQTFRQQADRLRKAKPL
jgi:hypothetical protein